MEVGGLEPGVRVAVDLRVEPRVAVGEILERDVEPRVQRSVERRRLRGVRAHRRVGRILVDDVVLRPPAAHVVREDHVRRELVAQLHPLLRERRGEVDRVRLLEVAPEIGLDVHDDRLRPVHAREEQSYVAPVRRHRLGVLQVRQVGVRLVTAARLRLQQHVVGQHRDLGVTPRVVDVHRREGAVRVPRRPALAGVCPAGEVLVAEAERRGPSQRRGAAGRVREPELKGVRPALGERRELRATRARCAREHDADEQHGSGDERS